MLLGWRGVPSLAECRDVNHLENFMPTMKSRLPRLAQLVIIVLYLFVSKVRPFTTT